MYHFSITILVLAVTISGSLTSNNTNIATRRNLTLSDDEKTPIIRINIDIEDCPFLASILVKGQLNTVGSIVTNKFILTIGHRVVSSHVAKEDLLIRVGSSKPNTGGSIYKVHDIHHPPGFRPAEEDDEVPKSYYHNNLALIELEGVINDPRARPVELVEASYTKLPEIGHLIGWEENQDPVTKANNWKLQRFRGQVWSVDTCNKWINYEQEEHTFGNDSICGLMRKRELEAELCTGAHAGAPLVDYDNRQFGLFWIYVGECIDEFPAIFALVAVFRDWIDETAFPKKATAGLEEETEESDYSITAIIGGSSLLLLLLLCYVAYEKRRELRSLFFK